MKKRLYIALILVSLFNFFTCAAARPDFKYGFGVGVNLALIQANSSYPLYEDLTGAQYSSKYSTLFQNFGNQYFFHGELQFNNIILALKPGTYTYRFFKTDEIIFTDETLNEKSSYLLRYLQVPLEAKWIIGNGTFKPFIGADISYGQLLRQGGNGNHSFIHPRISAGAVTGAYYELKSFDLNLTLGYDYGLHIITDKKARYNTSSVIAYSQSDIVMHNLSFSLSVLFSLSKSNLLKSLECITPKRR
jgi:hypothetical protein